MYLNPEARSWTHTSPAPSSSILTFHQQLPEYNVTPLVRLPEIEKELGLGGVFIKDESHRLALPAFKILGASWAIYNAVASYCGLALPSHSSPSVPPISLEELGSRAREKGVRLVTCTDGNWGRACARMGKYLGIPVRIYVPKYMDAATRERILSEGMSEGEGKSDGETETNMVQVIPVDGDYDIAVQTAREAGERGEGLLVMDVSFEGFEEIPNWVVEGYSTMLTETDSQLQQLVGKPLTHVFVSVGVGSWAQAVVSHYKSASTPSPHPTIISVEPTTAACLKTSLEAGHIVPIQTGHTIMDGLNCGTVSYSSWDVLRKGVDASVTVSDLEVHRDVQYLHEQGVMNGPCGAATLSGLRKVCGVGPVGELGLGLGLGKDSVVVLFSTEGARDYPVPAED